MADHLATLHVVLATHRRMDVRMLQAASITRISKKKINRVVAGVVRHLVQLKKMLVIQTSFQV